MFITASFYFFIFQLTKSSSTSPIGSERGRGIPRAKSDAFHTQAWYK